MIHHVTQRCALIRICRYNHRLRYGIGNLSRAPIARHTFARRARNQPRYNLTLQKLVSTVNFCVPIAQAASSFDSLDNTRRRLRYCMVWLGMFLMVRTLCK